MGVFGSNQSHAGSFKADLLKVNFGGVTSGMLIQNVQFNFQQQVSMLFEIGSEKTYYVGGRAQGSASVSRILGPGAAIATLFSTYGNICTPKAIAFSAEGGCGGASAAVNYTLKDAVLTSVGCNVTAQEIVISEQLQFMFIDLVLG